MLDGFHHVLGALKNNLLDEEFVVFWLVKKLAVEGGETDFINLPIKWRQAIINRFKEVDREGNGWITIGSACEDMIPYMDAVKEKYFR